MAHVDHAHVVEPASSTVHLRAGFCLRVVPMVSSVLHARDRTLAAALQPLFCRSLFSPRWLMFSSLVAVGFGAAVGFGVADVTATANTTVVLTAHCVLPVQCCCGFTFETTCLPWLWLAPWLSTHPFGRLWRITPCSQAATGSRLGQTLCTY